MSSRSVLVPVLLTVIVGSISSISAAKYTVNKPKLWWQDATFYQIWPSSFQDSNGDGIGDMKGIISRMPHFVDMGIRAIWISPFYPSPLADSGYDVSDFRDVNPRYGTLEDLHELTREAHKLGLKVIIDYVPNHTSDEHPWFFRSKNFIEPYIDYYVWMEGKTDNNYTRHPPNNWVSVFNSGSSWQWVEEHQAYYLHQFSVKQPDINFRNSLVIKETKDILTFWLDRGVDGFRIDACPFFIESKSMADEPPFGEPGYTYPDYYSLDHIYTKDQPEDCDIVQMWRDHIDDYTARKGDNVARPILTEAYSNISTVMKYYNCGSEIPFNFFFIKDDEGINQADLRNASKIVDIVNLWMKNMPKNGTANWVFGNHDNSRIATKLGQCFVDTVNILLMILPGAATIYNGDEIGMTDTYLTWEQTTDPQACSTDPTRYQAFSRDPERTPYQWDNSTSAGFSTNTTTVLPVNPNYVTLNLAAQKAADKSHYKNLQALIKLRSKTVVREGSLDVQLINNDVVALARERKGYQGIVALANWSNKTVTANLNSFPNVSNYLKVLVANICSGIEVGAIYRKSSIELPANASLVLQGYHNIVNHKYVCS